MRKFIEEVRWLPVLAAGLAAGGIWGAVSSWRTVAGNRYLDYELYRLALLTVRDHYNDRIVAVVLWLLVIAVTAALVRRIWRQWVSPVVSLRIHDPDGLARLAIFGASAAFFLVAGMVANKYFLPYRFAPVSLLADAVILLSTLALCRFAMRLRSRRMTWKLPGRLLGAFGVLGGMVLLLVNLAPLFGSVDLGSYQNVILISVDTLRYDGLGVNGSIVKESTPNLDRFAGMSVNFRDCTAQAPWTLPSHMSMLTSLYSQTHRMDTPKAWQGVVVDPAIVTLAEILRDRGYSTHAYTGGGFVGSQYGFSQGFESWQEGAIVETVSDVEEAIEDLQGSRFFLFWHTYEVHAPYTDLRYVDEFGGHLLIDSGKKELLRDYIANTELSPKRMVRFMQDIGLYNSTVARNLYLGDIAYMDEMVGRVLSRLEALGLLDETIVIFTSDHGEEFGEHNNKFYDSHSKVLFQEVVRVPLVVYFPNRDDLKGREVDTPVALVDIVPTVLEYLGVRGPAKVAGMNLLEALEDGPESERRSIFSETSFGGMRAVRKGRYKYIQNSCRQPCDGAEALYDIISDPGEQDNLIASEAQVAQALRAEIESYLEWGPRFLELEEKKATLDQKNLDRLKALGYLE